MINIKHQFLIKNSPEKVFDAFCQPEWLNAWWTLESAGKAELGGEYTFYFGSQYDWRGKVVHLVKDKELTWLMTDAMDDWKGTEVGFKLKEKEGGTTVSFFHTGWKENKDHLAVTNFCWGQLLKGLKNFIEEGTIIPFEKRNLDPE